MITAADRTNLHLQNADPVSCADFFRHYVGSHMFLIQNFVQIHSFLQRFSPTTAIVRMVNMWRDDGLWTPLALLNLPWAGNVADNFWRDGNLICQLDVETGKVLTVVGGAFELLQIATGKGFMTPEMHEFYRACGSTRLRGTVRCPSGCMKTAPMAAGAVFGLSLPGLSFRVRG